MLIKLPTTSDAFPNRCIYFYFMYMSVLPYGCIYTACMSVEAKRRGCWMLGFSGTKEDWRGAERISDI